MKKSAFKLENIGPNLKKARAYRLLGLRELAARSGVCVSTLSMMETGTKHPNGKLRMTSIESLIKICDELEVSADYLLGRKPMSQRNKKIEKIFEETLKNMGSK